jgi:hypothetical protein
MRGAKDEDEEDEEGSAMASRAVRIWPARTEPAMAREGSLAL